MDQQNTNQKFLLDYGKRIASLLAIMFIVFSCSTVTDNTYSISGQLENAAGKKLFLYEMGTYDLNLLDSLIIDSSGEFRFEGEFDEIRFMSLREDELNHLTLIVSPGEDIEINADMNNLQETATVEGSPESSLAVDLNRRMNTTIVQLDSLSQGYRDSLDKPGTDIDLLRTDTQDAFERISEEQRQFTIDFIDKNPASLASLMALYHQIDQRNFVLRQEEDFRYYTLVDSLLIEKYPDLDYTVTLNENISEMKAQMELNEQRESLLGDGAVAPEISLPNPDGDTINLSSLRGNYVLLDMWAAWCGPCREENPFLVETYNKYNQHGFEIYQVSLDRTREAWLKGIEEDNLQQWTHVSDLQFWSSVVVPLYKIEGIPANFLLDREGRIIARNLRGENLERALEELFNE